MSDEQSEQSIGELGDERNWAIDDDGEELMIRNVEVYIKFKCVHATFFKKCHHKTLQKCRRELQSPS